MNKINLCNINSCSLHAYAAACVRIIFGNFSLKNLKSKERKKLQKIFLSCENCITGHRGILLAMVRSLNVSTCFLCLSLHCMSFSLYRRLFVITILHWMFTDFFKLIQSDGGHYRVNLSRFLFEFLLFHVRIHKLANFTWINCHINHN